MDKTKALYSMIWLPGQHVGHFCQRYSWNGLPEKAQVALEKKSKDFCLCKEVKRLFAFVNLCTKISQTAVCGPRNSVQLEEQQFPPLAVNVHVHPCNVLRASW